MEKLKDLKGRKTILDLSKERIGRLRPVKVVSYKPVTWECLCDCGNVVTVPIGNLHGNHRRNTISCGCYRRENVSKLTRKRPYESLYSSFLYVCKVPGKGTDITYEDFLEFTRINKCHYCDVPIIWAKHNIHLRSPGHRQAYYLDRKDNLKGYTKDNVVVCCTRCNRGKSNLFSYDEWVEIGKCIRTMREHKAVRVFNATTA